MVIESGSAYRINKEYCDKITDGLFALMKDMGIWTGDINSVRESKVVYDKDICYLNADSSGIFIPAVSIYDKVKKGDKIGSIVDVITGSVEEVVLASADGMICSIREYPVIEEGSLLARILGGDEHE